MNDQDFRLLCATLTENFMSRRRLFTQHIDDSNFIRQIQSGLEMSKRHYDFESQLKALDVVPVDDLHLEANQRVCGQLYNVSTGHNY